MAANRYPAVRFIFAPSFSFRGTSNVNVGQGLVVLIDKIRSREMTDSSPVSRNIPAHRVTSSSSLRHFPCLDGYRAIAAFAVLVTHVSYITGHTHSGRYAAFSARLDIGL